MSALSDYVTSHSERISNTFEPADSAGSAGSAVAPSPAVHEADMIFFGMKLLPGADAASLRELIRAHHGEFVEVDLFDGGEHSYIEIGGWIGDQGLALMLMGMGSLLGLWNLLTPKTVLGGVCTQGLAMQMARSGYVSIQAPSEGSPAGQVVDHAGA